MKRLFRHHTPLLALAAALWLIGPPVIALIDPGTDYGFAHAKGGDDSGGDDDNSGSGSDDDDDGDNSGSGGGGGSDDDNDDNSGGGGGGSDDDNEDDNSGSGGSGSDADNSGNVSGKSGDARADSIRNGYFVRFRDGHMEAVRDGMFLRLDRRGRVVDQRRATSGDLTRLERLRSAIRRDDDVSTVAVVNAARGLIQVIDDRGWTETIESGIYMLTDPDGNRVTKRKATSRDKKRLSSALR